MMIQSGIVIGASFRNIPFKRIDCPSSGYDRFILCIKAVLDVMYAGKTEFFMCSKNLVLSKIGVLKKVLECY